MAKFTILTAKKALAIAYPDIEFTYGTAGRGRMRGTSISWVGGPSPDDIRTASQYEGIRWNSPPYHFVRQPTPEEHAALLAKWDAEDRARVAAEPARRAAAKAAGIAKRRETVAFKRERAATLETTFPNVCFVVAASGDVAWTDGPEVEEVCALLSIQTWRCSRQESPAYKADKTRRDAVKGQTSRLARRLAQSKVRAIRVSRGIARRERLERNAQLWLPFGPSIVAFNARVMMRPRACLTYGPQPLAA